MLMISCRRYHCRPAQGSMRTSGTLQQHASPNIVLPEVSSVDSTLAIFLYRKQTRCCRAAQGPMSSSGTLQQHALANSYAARVDFGTGSTTAQTISNHDSKVRCFRWFLGFSLVCCFSDTEVRGLVTPKPLTQKPQEYRHLPQVLCLLHLLEVSDLLQSRFLFQVA